MTIPKRQIIHKALETQKRALQISELEALLKLGRKQSKSLRERLEAMVRDGQIGRDAEGAYHVRRKTQRITGIFIASDGGASVKSDRANDVYREIPDSLAHGLVDGDRVAVRISKKSRLPIEIELLARDREVAGVVEASGYIKPLHKIGVRRIQYMAGDESSNGSLEKGKRHDEIRAGSIVIVRLQKPDFHTDHVAGKIIEILGDYRDAAREIEIVLRACNIPSRWSDEALAEADGCNAVSPRDLARRHDLRGMNFVTIDGEDAKDFDDAVFFEKTGSGWELWVAIADVSSYVKPGSALDRAACERGNSVYFPGRVVPMLPPVLSDNLCSLLPQEERLAMVCRIKLSRRGEILEYSFMRAVMISKARLSYAQAARFLKSGKGLGSCPREICDMLNEGLSLLRQLLKQRKKRGALDLDLTETQILLDNEGMIRQVVSCVRNDAHRLIEECMICANVCAAEFLSGHKQNTLYRTHAGFKQDALEGLKFFLQERGIKLPGESTRDVASLLGEITGRSDAHGLQLMILRSLARALYQTAEFEHHGLALERYTHFTSPIRRYPDLLVHRAIGRLIDPAAAEPVGYDGDELEKVGGHCSLTEQRADDATRDITKYLKCLFMQGRVGEAFTGIVVGVTSFGLFLELEKVYVEGLLHIGSLDRDYYHFDSQGHRLVGKSSGKEYRLGDRIDIVISQVLPEERKIDFVLAGNYDARKRHRKNRRRRA